MGKAARRFSQASNMVATYINDLVSKDERQDPTSGLPYLETLGGYSLSVPLRLRHGDNLEDDTFLTDRRMKSALEQAGLINWCPGIKHQVPLAVTNDGNTLCHSASLALWGIHDRQLHLRRLIGKALESPAQEDFKQRWQQQVWASRAKLKDLNFQQDMEAEWQVLVDLTGATTKSVRSNNPLFEPLEEFHAFVLANVLRRPILIFADRTIRSCEPEEMNSCFAALYLPLLWPSQLCWRSPLILGYYENYFAPLVTFGNVLEDANSKDPCPTVIPLVGIDKIPIEHRYLLEQEELNKEKLLSDYLFTAEIESTSSRQVTHHITVAKLIPNPMNESQKLVAEFLSQRESQEPTPAEKQTTRKLSKFRCGNKTCTKYIDQDHLFPYCSECHPKLTSSTSKKAPTRRKMNSANTVVPPTSLEVECATLGCPYYAAVSCFPHCQRCKSLETSALTESSSQRPNDMSLEERWQKLAMGVVDEQLVSGMMQTTIQSPQDDEVLIAKICSHGLVEDGDKFAMGAATSTRSIPADQLKQKKPSATGARSALPRKISREELLLATNAIAIDSADDWKRKVSWINEPCIRPSCPYFASARTYPYCNQCAIDIQNAPGPVPRNRKVSGTLTLSTVTQED